MRPKLLIVADPAASAALCASIDAEAWDVACVELGSGALVTAVHSEPATVIIDARTDCRSLVQFCRTFRAVPGMTAVPLIALTHPGRADDRIALLEAGADDCWTEEVESREFQLRLRAINRRLQLGRAGRILKHQDIELDLDRYTVRANGTPVQLTAMQLKVLQHFMENPGVIFSRKELLEQVWGNPSIDEGAVTACIVRIRRALQAAGGPSAIRNVRSTGGYLFDAESEAVDQL